jgi:odorant receptor
MSQTFKLVGYTSAMSWEIFMHCYFGNEITFMSQKFSNSLFHSDWFNTNVKAQKSVSILMENFKNDLKIKLFNLYTLNLSSFMTILNSAYSYLMLLRSLRDN